ncbi:hypothetical protein [Paenibacillus gansuensis]|uniref:DUF4878 domain-containing protein n=1 Tax=Paenibacillus gansuensis TaxID=306542 RepID=A0ABW5PIG7_9BACL
MFMVATLAGPIIMLFLLYSLLAEMIGAGTVIFLFSLYFAYAIIKILIRINKVRKDWFSFQDTRWENEAAQKAGYEDIYKEDVLYDAKIMSITPAIDKKYGNIYNATISAKNNMNGTFQITLPVVKDKQQWKVLITGIALPPASQ